MTAKKSEPDRFLESLSKDPSVHAHGDVYEDENGRRIIEYPSSRLEGKGTFNNPYKAKPESEEPKMASKLFEYDEDDDDVEEIVRVSKARSGREKSPDEQPVENAEPIPLLPNISSNDERKVICRIRVVKRTPPFDGIKGEIDTTCGLDFVAKRWGDGTYDFEGINQVGQVLRRNTNVRLSFGYESNGTPVATAGAARFVPSSDPNIAERLLERQAQQHERDAERAGKAASEAIGTAKELSTNYAQMIREDSQARIERDRAYYAEASKQQANFFQSILVTMQQMHEQTMERSREGFAQTIQIMQQSHEHTLMMTNPANILGLFREGLKMGQETSGGEGPDPVSAVLTAGLGGLHEIKEMMALRSQAQAQPAMLSSGKAPNPSRRSSSGTEDDQTRPAKRRALDRAELHRIVKLKRLARRKGMDFDGLLDQAETMMGAAPSVGNVEPEGNEADEHAGSIAEEDGD